MTARHTGRTGLVHMALAAACLAAMCVVPSTGAAGSETQLFIPMGGSVTAPDQTIYSATYLTVDGGP
jgi:hypothetical protein